MQPVEMNVQAPTKRACDRCRRMKAKCDSVNFSCTNCSKLDRSCTFHVPSGKRGPKGNARRNKDSPGSISVLLDTPQSLPSTDGEQLVVQSRSPPTSTTSQLQPLSQALPSTEPSYFPRPWQHLAAVITAKASPKGFQDIVRECTDLFFEYISPCTVLVDEVSFRVVVEHAFLPSIPETEPPGPAAAMITALCAKVCFFMPSDLFAEGKALGEVFLKASRQFLSEYAGEDLENPDASSIIIRYLQSNCLHASARHKISWHVFGEVIRLIQGMKLNEESSYAPLPPLEADLRRKAFWQAYIGDKSMSMLKSMPMALHKYSFSQGITTAYPVEKDEALIAFNVLIRMWKYSSDLLLHLRFVRDRDTTFSGHHGSLGTTDRALLDRLHLCFLTTLDDLPPSLQPGGSSVFDQGNARRTKRLAIQIADLQSTFHSLRLHVLQALEEAGYFDPIELHRSMLMFRKTEIAQEMVRFMQNAPFWSLQVNGEPCVEKIRLVGASLLAIIHDDETSPLTARAQRDVSVLLNILTRLDSRASFALPEGASQELL